MALGIRDQSSALPIKVFTSSSSSLDHLLVKGDDRLTIDLFSVVHSDSPPIANPFNNRHACVKRRLYWRSVH